MPPARHRDSFASRPGRVVRRDVASVVDTRREHGVDARQCINDARTERHGARGPWQKCLAVCQTRSPDLQPRRVAAVYTRNVTRPRIERAFRDARCAPQG